MHAPPHPPLTLPSFSLSFTHLLISQHFAPSPCSSFPFSNAASILCPSFLLVNSVHRQYFRQLYVCFFLFPCVSFTMLHLFPFNISQRYLSLFRPRVPPPLLLLASHSLSLSLLVLAPLSPSILLTLPPLYRFASPHPLPTLCPFLFPSVVPFHKPRPSPSSTSFHFLTLQSTSVHSISLPCSSALPYSCAAPPRPLSLLLPPFPGAHWPHSSLVQLSDVLIIFRLTATLPLSSRG